MTDIKRSKTSVIITTYNDAKYLKRSIPSIIAQSSKPFEVIIIDDGSYNDNAKVIINSFRVLTDIPIVYKKKKNGGPSSARNEGIKLAKGEFILFIDADDELLQNSIEWRQEILESLDQDYASIYCSKIQHFKNKSKAAERVIETNGRLNVCLVGRGNNAVPGQIASHLFRKDILIKVNGYKESLKFNEDFELILRIAKKCKFYGVDKVGFIQHVREDSWSNSDPYVAYHGVEAFLETALEDELLPITEINLRRKQNKLSLAKRILVRRNKWKEAVPYIDEAFDIIKPQNIKELTLFIFNKILKFY
ncbi:MAG: glycosyltransferase family A protein [Gammaproteobacteria bacterium]